MKEKIKSFNKILSLTSLFSVAMLMMPFSVNAADSGKTTEEVVETLNLVNQQYPDTKNEKAIYANIKSKESEFFTKEGEQNFCFLINGKCANCITTGGCATDCRVESVSNNSKTYVSPFAEKTLGFYEGGMENILDEGGNDFKGYFFRYWDPSQTAKDKKTGEVIYQGAYSAAYPRLCYTGITNTKKGIEPLKNLVKSKSMAYKRENNNNYLELKVNTIDNKGVTASGIYKVTTVSSMVDGNVKVKDFKKSNVDGVTCLEPIVNSDTVTVACKNNITNTYNYTDESCPNNNKLKNCSNLSSENCSLGQIKNYYRDASNNPYRTSAFVTVAGISGNTKDFEIPQQTCFVCSAIDNPNVYGSDCNTVVREAFNATGKNCELTVKFLVTNLSSSGEERFNMYKTGVPCNCLTSIEGLLRGLGCS